MIAGGLTVFPRARSLGVPLPFSFRPPSPFPPLASLPFPPLPPSAFAASLFSPPSHRPRGLRRLGVTPSAAWQ